MSQQNENFTQETFDSCLEVKKYLSHVKFFEDYDLLKGIDEHR